MENGKKKKLIMVVSILVVIVLIGSFGFVKYNNGKKISNLQERAEGFNKVTEQCILDIHEEEVNALKELTGKAIKDKDSSKVDGLISDMDKLEEVVVARSLMILNGKFKEIEGVDTSKFSDKSQKEFEERVKKAKKLMEEKKYIDCREELLAIGKLIENENKSSRELTVDDAYSRIEEEDSQKVEGAITSGGRLTYAEKDKSSNFKFKELTEDCYIFYLSNGNNVVGVYFVGKNSGDVYRGPSNGGHYIDLIEDGKGLVRLKGPTYDEYGGDASNPPLN